MKMSETIPLEQPTLEGSAISHLVGLATSEIASVDLALMNLLCAMGLPGAERLDVAACETTLDRWAVAVGRYVADCRPRFERSPGEFQHEEGLFCFLCMVTLLKHPRGLGIRYQPRAIGSYVFSDSRDDFLHGLITRRLGTCASLPVLFVAIGRRLGWPMHLAVAKGHVLCQWVCGNGKRLNLEGSCDGGGNLYPNEYYHRWPRPLTQADLASGRYLRPLTGADSFALFLETRGHCLADNGRFEEARQAYLLAGRASPQWSQAENHLYVLQLQDLQAQRRGSRKCAPNLT